MKGLNYLHSILVVLMCMSCASKMKFENANEEQKDTTVVFFDASHYSREEIGKLIEMVNEFKPKVIALAFQFDSLSDVNEDSLLANSISKAGNVILSAEIRDPDLTIVGSHSVFSKSAVDVGVISYLVSRDSSVTQYTPLFDNDSVRMPSFPDLIAFTFRPGSNTNFTNFKINKRADIEYSKSLNDFSILNESNLSADLIENRIVIFGDLNKANEYLISIGDDKRVRTNLDVITANIILQRLREVD